MDSCWGFFPSRLQEPAGNFASSRKMFTKKKVKSSATAHTMTLYNKNKTKKILLMIDMDPENLPARQYGTVSVRAA